MSARRYNKGKLRYELVSEIGLEKLVDVYTKGAHKYTLYKDKEGNTIKGSDISLDKVGNYEVVDSGDDNWRKGMLWKDTIASVKRHIALFDSGEDIDELGTYHLANAAWGLFTILDYYKTHPELDNRNHRYLSEKKIGLDIDEVLCDWVGAWTKEFGYPIPENWDFSYFQHDHFKKLQDEGKLDDFYLNLPIKRKPSEIPFIPHCYITSRSVPIEVTKAWLQKNGFPTIPVYSVGFGKSKVDVAKESGIDLFVDDSYYNFVELNKAGICTFLLDAPHNRQHNVGYKRIKTLDELI